VSAQLKPPSGTVVPTVTSFKRSIHTYPSPCILGLGHQRLSREVRDFGYLLPSSLIPGHVPNQWPLHSGVMDFDHLLRQAISKQGFLDYVQLYRTQVLNGAHSSTEKRPIVTRIAHDQASVPHSEPGFIGTQSRSEKVPPLAELFKQGYRLIEHEGHVISYFVLLSPIINRTCKTVPASLSTTRIESSLPFFHSLLNS
jgi:hypothetical protein